MSGQRSILRSLGSSMRKMILVQPNLSHNNSSNHNEREILEAFELADALQMVNKHAQNLDVNKYPDKNELKLMRKNAVTSPIPFIN